MKLLMKTMNVIFLIYTGRFKLSYVLSYVVTFCINASSSINDRLEIPPYWLGWLNQSEQYDNPAHRHSSIWREISGTGDIPFIQKKESLKNRQPWQRMEN
jgi:hypothetical protein